MIVNFVKSFIFVHLKSRVLVWFKLLKSHLWAALGSQASFIWYNTISLGLVYTTPAGQPILELVDYHGGSLLILFLAVLEIIGLAWIYSSTNLLKVQVKHHHNLWPVGGNGVPLFQSDFPLPTNLPPQKKRRRFSPCSILCRIEQSLWFKGVRGVHIAIGPLLHTPSPPLKPEFW